MFSAIVHTAYYPSVVAFSLSFLAFFFELRFLNHRSKKALSAALILGGLAFVNHPLTGSFYLVCFILLLIERNGWNKKTIGLTFLAAAVVLALSVVWPYYSFFASLFEIFSGRMSAAGDYQLTWQYLHSKPVLRMGFALTALPLIGILACRRQHLLLTGGFAFFSAIYIFGTVTRISLSERFVFFILVMLQMTFACFWGSWAIPGRKYWKKGARVMTLLILGGILLQTGLAWQTSVWQAFRQVPGKVLPRYENPNRMQLELRQYLSEKSIVMADIYSGWALPVYTGARIIALYHTPPHIADNLQRYRDTERFYALNTPRAKRRELLERYKVTHVFFNYVLNAATRAIAKQMPQLGYKKMVGNKRYAVYRIDR